MRLQWIFILVLTALIGVGSALPAWAGEPITATFWYSYGGKVRQVTEDMVKKFNSSQTKYRIDGSFQGDYFQALAKIRAAITTKTAPTIFHVIGEAMPDLWQGGMFENLEPYVKSTGVKTEEFVKALSQPCPYCEAALRHKYVKRVYYTVSDEEYAVMNLL